MYVLTYVIYIFPLSHIQGDLYFAILECHHFCESDVAVVMWSLGHALMYLHNHKIVHRGISAESLFVSGFQSGSQEWSQGWALRVGPGSGLRGGSKEWIQGVGPRSGSQEWVQGVGPRSGS